MIPKRQLTLFLLCASFSPLAGMKNVKKLSFGKNIFSYDRITHEIKHYNKHRSIDSWFLKNGKLWEKRVTLKGKYDILPVVVTNNGEWLAQKLTHWEKIKKFLGIKIENPDQIQVPHTGYFSTHLSRQPKIFPKRSKFPKIYKK